MWVDGGGNNNPVASVMDFGSYLGDEFKDYGIAVFNPETYSVAYAGYATTESGWEEISDFADETDFAAINEAAQKEAAKGGAIYGIYPAPKASNS